MSHVRVMRSRRSKPSSFSALPFPMPGPELSTKAKSHRPRAEYQCELSRRATSPVVAPATSSADFCYQLLRFPLLRHGVHPTDAIWVAAGTANGRAVPS